MKYDLLFEPQRIGPVTAPNRFYQVPHCNGMGHLRPRAEAATRAIKAEGGWGVVCTQEVEIHPSSEISPAFEGRIWDDADIPVHQLITESIHQHDSLAGIEFVYNGHHAPNLYSRIPPMSVSSMPVDCLEPVQARAMNKRDIANVRHWHVDAARRAQRAGYDIVYVYAGHNMSLLMHSMLTRFNKRTDDYGGSLENRVRMTREILEAVKDAVGDTCAVAFRFAVDEMLGADGLAADAEAHDVVAMLAEIPDLWDVNVSDWSNDSATARFEPDEGYQEKYTHFVKSLTSKPVVGVGRFTSPDVMVSQIKRGVLDFVGAARPSIADPFLPQKIREDALETVRECIGCNICVACDNTMAPIRCTQNPTMGEEWKRGWHPERTVRAEQPLETLVVGAGPAGLECAWQLAKRGHRVLLAETETELGGRALRESTLPGLGSYIRVRDYRVQQLQRCRDVTLLPDNRLSAADIIDTGIDHIFLATGSHWRRDGFGRQHPNGIAVADTSVEVYTPDDILNGLLPTGRVLVYDDDHYYMGGVVAERLREAGCDVVYVSPESVVSSWTVNTLEQHKIQSRLLGLDVELVLSHEITALQRAGCIASCVYSGRTRTLDCNGVVMVTARQPNNHLKLELEHRADSLSDAQSGCLTSLIGIGDSDAPATIAAAVFSGHLAACEFDNNDANEPWPYQALFRRELISLEHS